MAVRDFIRGLLMLLVMADVSYCQWTRTAMNSSIHCPKIQQFRILSREETYISYLRIYPLSA